MRRTSMIASTAFGLATCVATCATPGWAQLGPYDQAGTPIRVETVVAVGGSSTLYAGGASGVFRSDDKGANWMSLGRPGDSETYQLVLDPSAAATVYAETNKGLFKTTDGGTTWFASGFQDQFISALAVDPVEPLTLYAGTWAAGESLSGFIFKSHDAGATWSQVDQLPFAVVLSLGVDPLDPSIVFAGTDGGSVLRSGDAGESWAPVDVVPGSVMQLVPDPSTAGVVYSRWGAQHSVMGLPAGALRRTPDGITDWSDISGLPSRAAGPFLIDPNDPNVSFYEADGSLYRSGDHGQHWGVVGSAANAVELAIFGGDPDHLYDAGDGVRRLDLAVLPPHCDATPTTLCLQNGRFSVEVDWQLAPLGPSFQAQAVPLTTESGYFWFFGPNNVELMVKVLDGTAINDHFWVLYGALSDVAYTVTVTDTLTGAQRHYDNPRGTLASVADTEAFPNAVSANAAIRPPTALTTAAAAAVCDPDPTALCLEDGRFQVRVQWQSADGVSSSATAVPLTGDTGYFWFFNESNVELVVKVLDGRLINGHFWVFYGALSNVQYEITVTDTQTGATQVYENPQGNLASVADTRAF